MFVNWLPNNVPKLSTVLCSAGMMVPWLLPNRAVAHDQYRTENWSVETGYSTSRSGAQSDLANELSQATNDCRGRGGDQLSVSNTRINEDSFILFSLYYGEGDVECRIPESHEHEPEDLNAVMYANADCDCGNCEEGCDS